MKLPSTTGRFYRLGWAHTDEETHLVQKMPASESKQVKLKEGEMEQQPGAHFVLNPPCRLMAVRNRLS